MAETSKQPLPTAVTVVHAQACHFCDDARAALAELGLGYPLDIEFIAAEDPRGRALLAEHRSPMFPLILVDGRFFSAGRLSSKKMRKLLDTNTVAVA